VVRRERPRSTVAIVGTNKSPMSEATVVSDTVPLRAFDGWKLNRAPLLFIQNASERWRYMSSGCDLQKATVRNVADLEL